MKRQFLFSSVFAAAMAVGLGAQGTGTTGQATGQTPDRNQGQTMTVTGCLKKADELSRPPAGAQAGAQMAQKSDDEFVILRPAGMTAFNVRTGAAQTGQTAQSQAGQTGQTAGTAGTSGAAQLGFRLVGGDNLEQHVNKQVEIRGTLAERPGATPQTGQTQGSRPDVDDLPELRVTSVRHVSDSCSASGR